MTVVMRRWFDDDLLPFRNRDSWWGQSDSWMDEWKDWPKDWPKPRELMGRFHRDSDRFWHDWPAEWPEMNAVMPKFTSHLDTMDRNWREDPFWRELYPRWAEPIFKEGIDVHSNIVNDRSRFAVDIDCYQFRPEEIQVKTLDDTLMIEGRHEDVRDRDNFTKMYFVRKYQLPSDVDAGAISSSIDSRGRLTVEARKRHSALHGRERLIPIEGGSKHRSSSASPRSRHDSGHYSNHSNGYSPRGMDSPMHVDTTGSMSGRVRETRYETAAEAQFRREQEIKEREERPYRMPYGTASGSSFEIPIRATGLPHGRDGYSHSAQHHNHHHHHNKNSFFHRSESRSSNNLATTGTAVPIHHVDDHHMYSPRRASIEGRFERPYSPHRLTMENEYRANGDDSGSLGRSAFDSIRDKFEKGYRSQSRSSSHKDYPISTGYRVESPAFSHRSNGHNGNHTNNGGESRTESIHSVRIERKTHY